MTMTKQRGVTLFLLALALAALGVRSCDSMRSNETLSTFDLGKRGESGPSRSRNKVGKENRPEEVSPRSARREIAGTVLDESGKAIGGARVRIMETVKAAAFGPPSPVIAEGVTGSDGCFLFEVPSVNSSEQLVLVAETAGLAIGILPVPKIETAGTHAIRLHLTAPAARGVTLDTRGLSVSGLKVHVDYQDATITRGRALRLQEETDQAGEFRCVEPKRQRGSVRVFWPDGDCLDDFIGNNERDRKGRIVFQMVPGSPLTLCAVWEIDRRPAANVDFLVSTENDERAFVATTDDHGNAAISNFPAATRARVESRTAGVFLACGEERLGESIFARGLSSIADRRLDLLLSSGSLIRGRVVTDSSAPVAGVEVTCTSISTRGRSVRMSRTTDESGRFEFSPIAGGWHKLSCDGLERGIDVERMSREYAAVPGPFALLQRSRSTEPAPTVTRRRFGARARHLEVFASDANPADDVLFFVARKGEVVGRVADQAGQAIAGAEVVIRQAGSVFRDQGSDAPEIAACRARTDDLGRFTLRNVPIGDWKVACSAPGHAWAESAGFSMSRGGRVVDLTIRMHATRSLAIEVFDGEGRAVAYLGLEIHDRGTDTNLTTHRLDNLITDAEGRATSDELGPGRHLLRLIDVEERGLILGDSSERLITEEELRRGQKSIRLVRARKLSGRVLDQEGRPIVRGFVSFLRFDADEGQWTPVPYGPCETDHDGRFERLVTREGQYRIRGISVAGLGSSRTYSVPAPHVLHSDLDGGVLEAELRN